VPFEQEVIFNKLKGEPPEAWLSYIRHQDRDNTAAGLSMDVIYSHAAVLAKKQHSLEWARVAIEAAELWAHRTVGVERESALLRAMKLRSWFVSKMGSRSDDYVLDKITILRWVLAGLRMTPHEASEKASVLWKRIEKARNSGEPAAMESAVAELRELRKIKHRLTVAKVLADSGELPLQDSLDEWLKIRDQMP
jgi:hypothetical protein